jgi:Hemocyanin, copper containing domain
MKLDENTGIEILGNLIEPSALYSDIINHDYYGAIHNKGHNIIAASHDPENHYLEGLGVMSLVRYTFNLLTLFNNFKYSLRPQCGTQSFIAGTVSSTQFLTGSRCFFLRTRVNYSTME